MATLTFTDIATASKLTEHSNATASKLKHIKRRSIAVSKQSSDIWLAKVYQTQNERVTPQMRERMKARALKQQRATKAARKCKKMQSVTRSSKSSWAGAMRNMSSVKKSYRSAPSSAASNDALQQQQYASEMETVSAAANMQLQSVQSQLRTISDDVAEDELYGSFGGGGSLSCGEGKTDETETENSTRMKAVEVDALALELDAAEELEEEANAVQEDEMEVLLADLRDEPDTDTERAAKFALYEAYLETVSAARSAMFSFWENDAKPEFDNATAIAAVERDLARIDSAANMGIPDFDGPVWFVFGMCNKVIFNNDLMERTLKGIRTKLDLLSRQDACPVCLDSFGDGTDESGPVAQVLGCCHKVCDECWAHWKAACGGRAFCPLCRNEEFVSDLIAMAENN